MFTLASSLFSICRWEILFSASDEVMQKATDAGWGRGECVPGRHRHRKENHSEGSILCGCFEITKRFHSTHCPSPSPFMPPELLQERKLWRNLSHLCAKRECCQSLPGIVNEPPLFQQLAESMKTRLGKKTPNLKTRPILELIIEMPAWFSCTKQLGEWEQSKVISPAGQRWKLELNEFFCNRVSGRGPGSAGP